MKLLKCFLVFVFLFLVPCSSAARISLKKKLQVENLLKRLNKPPQKSIKSSDGDTIDCIPISQQPAFDHPLLKNHKLQLEPSCYPEGPSDYKIVNSLKYNEGLKPIKQVWRFNGNCGEETIPVRRTKKANVLRADFIKNYGTKKKNVNILSPNSAKPESDPPYYKQHEHTIAYVNGDKYFGTKANINVWQPEVQQPNEFSISQIWVLGGSLDEHLNSIEAGWQVGPHLYGDNNTRLFTYWTRDGYNSTGCYNLLCSGFIQISQKIALGATIAPVSSYQGSQFDIAILIWKDPDGGNWWMKLLNDDEVIGYWPASLFTNLGDGATTIEWGGEVINLASGGQHTTTQMGSGHFPGEGFTRASFFKNIQVVDESNQLKVPEDVQTLSEQPSCYDIQLQNREGGIFFFYGGPGRNPKCP